jgi:hypothetical protein
MLYSEEAFGLPPSSWVISIEVSRQRGFPYICGWDNYLWQVAPHLPPHARHTTIPAPDSVRT